MRREAFDPQVFENGGSKSSTIFGLDVAARTGTNLRTGSPFPRVAPRPSPTRFAANLLPDGAESDETEQDELGNPGRAGR